jgi:hypothetical protein
MILPDGAGAPERQEARVDGLEETLQVRPRSQRVIRRVRDHAARSIQPQADMSAML